MRTLIMITLGALLVAITYNPKKTDVETLSKAFAKIDYKVKVISDGPEQKDEKKKRSSE